MLELKDGEKKEKGSRLEVSGCGSRGGGGQGTWRKKGGIGVGDEFEGKLGEKRGRMKSRKAPAGSIRKSHQKDRIKKSQKKTHVDKGGSKAFPIGKEGRHPT